MFEAARRTGGPPYLGETSIPMLDVNAFKGYCFDPQTVGNFDDVITPPFDVIGDEDREALAARSPYNITHVILPKPEGERDC